MLAPLQTRWQDALDKARSNRTVFAQRAIRPAEVLPEWHKQQEALGSQAEHALLLSTKTQAGLEDLRQRLLQIAGWQSLPEGVFAARERHLQALREVAAHISTAQTQLLHPPVMLDLMAEELRLAQNALSSITGEFTADDLLGVIFSSFCIGK